MDSNSLYYGDNLDILRRYVQDESVDLIYLDPPFNSNQIYNILFQEKDGTQSASQIKAFGDTWHWCAPKQYAPKAVYWSWGSRCPASCGSWGSTAAAGKSTPGEALKERTPRAGAPRLGRDAEQSRQRHPDPARDTLTGNDRSFPQ